MNTIFNKIYVISLISNKHRQEFIRYQMNELGLDFEFIYGIDFYNLKKDRSGKNIKYPKLVRNDYNHLDNYRMYGCTMAHYQAILQAYEFGYNKILIIEDDSCFIKNKELIESYFNNIPEDADYITYSSRFLTKQDCINFNKELKKYYKTNKDKNYIKLSNEYLTLCGTMCYALMNRRIMKKYLDNQRDKLFCVDHIKDIYENPTINRYSAVKAICIDQFNVLTNNKFNHKYIGCSYQQHNLVNKNDEYFEPEWYEISNINKRLNRIIYRIIYY